VRHPTLQNPLHNLLVAVLVLAQSAVQQVIQDAQGGQTVDLRDGVHAVRKIRGRHLRVVVVRGGDALYCTQDELEPRFLFFPSLIPELVHDIQRCEHPPPPDQSEEVDVRKLPRALCCCQLGAVSVRLLLLAAPAGSACC